MTPFDDRGRVVITRPWEWLSEDERLDQLRSLSTARCFPYQRLEMRSGGPVCVEAGGGSTFSGIGPSLILV